MRAEPGAAEPGVPDSQPAVAISALTMSYGGRTAVADLWLTVARNRLTVVLGPNGAGKTTTVEACEGLRRVQQGSVRVLGLAPADPGLRARVGVMLQSGGCYSGARAPELVRHFARLYRTPQDPEELIGLLQLDRLGRTTYRRMSGGERARLSLALALVGRPELVFLDEPSAGLDPQARIALWELLDRLRGAGVTVVLTTHQLDEAERLADDVVILDSGRLRSAGPLSDLTGADGPVISFSSNAQAPIAELLQLLGPAARLRSADPGRFQIAGCPDPAALTTVVLWAAAHSLPLRELSSGPRRLTDVYLEIIGGDHAA